MKSGSWPIFIVSLALIASAAVFINYRRHHQRLGVPGVRVAAQAVHNPQGQVVATNAVALPERVLDYTSQTTPVANEVLDWLPKDTVYGQRHYKSAADGFEIAVNAVLMGADRTSIHKPQYCLTGTGWMITSSELTTLPISQPRPYALPMMKLGLKRDVPAPNGELARWHGFYVYWFIADGQLTADHHERMWWMARDLVRTGVLQRWAYIACLVVCQPGREAPAYDRLTAFLQAAVPEFQLTVGSGAGSPADAAKLAKAAPPK